MRIDYIKEQITKARGNLREYIVKTTITENDNLLPMPKTVIFLTDELLDYTKCIDNNYTLINELREYFIKYNPYFNVDLVVTTTKENEVFTILEVSPIVFDEAYKLYKDNATVKIYLAEKKGTNPYLYIMYEDAEFGMACLDELQHNLIKIVNRMNESIAESKNTIDTTPTDMRTMFAYENQTKKEIDELKKEIAYLKELITK